MVPFKFLTLETIPEGKFLLCKIPSLCSKNTQFSCYSLASFKDPKQQAIGEIQVDHKTKNFGVFGIPE